MVYKVVVANRPNVLAYALDEIAFRSELSLLINMLTL